MKKCHPKGLKNIIFKIFQKYQKMLAFSPVTTLKENYIQKKNLV